MPMMLHHQQHSVSVRGIVSSQQHCNSIPERVRTITGLHCLHHIPSLDSTIEARANARFNVAVKACCLVIADRASPIAHTCATLLLKTAMVFKQAFSVMFCHHVSRFA